MAKKAQQSKPEDLNLDKAKELLIEEGKKKGSLTYAEIAAKLAPFTLDSDQMDEFFGVAHSINN